MVTQTVRPRFIDRIMMPVHGSLLRSDATLHRKLLDFSATEADSGRTMARAAETTRDPVLRDLFIRHALDEQRHTELFRACAARLRANATTGADSSVMADLVISGERGLDAITPSDETVTSFLAFVHLSERAAASRFSAYSRVARRATIRATFEQVACDETFHAEYTLAQLRRVAGKDASWFLLRARGRIAWNSYLRAAARISALLANIPAMAIYLVLLGPTAIVAQMKGRKAASGWIAADRGSNHSLHNQF